MKTLVGLIPDNEHVVIAEEAMKDAGIGESEISALLRPAEVWERLGGHSKFRVVLKFTLFGALFGLAVGAIYGLPAGITNCVQMGYPFKAILGFLVAISLYWVFGGAFLGAIIGLDRLERDLYSYVEGVRRGAALMIVETPDEQASEVTRILQREGGLLVHSLERG
jgi:hypothetical protein